MLNPLLTIISSKKHTPPHPYSSSPQTDSLKKISSPPNPTINIYLQRLKNLRAPPLNLQQGNNRRRTSIQIPASMIAK